MSGTITGLGVDVIVHGHPHTAKNGQNTTNTPPIGPGTVSFACRGLPPLHTSIALTEKTNQAGGQI